MGMFSGPTSSGEGWSEYYNYHQHQRSVWVTDYSRMYFPGVFFRRSPRFILRLSPFS